MILFKIRRSIGISHFFITGLNIINSYCNIDTVFPCREFGIIKKKTPSYILTKGICILIKRYFLYRHCPCRLCVQTLFGLNWYGLLDCGLPSQCKQRNWYWRFGASSRQKLRQFHFVCLYVSRHVWIYTYILYINKIWAIARQEM